MVKSLFHLFSALFLGGYAPARRPPAVFALKFFLDCFKFFLSRATPALMLPTTDRQ